jgi:predicted Zn-dependent protease with MMP-like domain
MGWDTSLPASGTGFLEASPRGVAIIGVTPWDTLGSFLIRVQNFRADSVTAKIGLNHVNLQDAYLGTILGERSRRMDRIGNSLTVPLERYEIKTIVVATQ